MSVYRHLPFANQLRTAKFFLGRYSANPKNISMLARYLFGIRFGDVGDDVHLIRAMEWLAKAQDEYGDGVSNVFYFHTGWGVGYPETSGYIIATFLAYADYSGDNSYLERAKRIAQWEINIQPESGGVLSSPDRPETRVFNTGQVMLGWCALYSRTQEDSYLKAATRAGEYLLRLQEEDGSWVSDTYCGARTYHARVDWALVRLFNLTGDIRFLNAAKLNLKWVVSQVNNKGWFAKCGFNEDEPITHVIEYTLGGLLGCYVEGRAQITDLKILDLVELAAQNLIASIESNSVKGIAGMVPASFDSDWVGNCKNSCLTGNSQIASMLYRLTHITNNMEYKKFADIILSATKTTQYTGEGFLDIRGGIPGSYPISHGYVPNGFPNWAAKFFADALLMKLGFSKRLDIEA